MSQKDLDSFDHLYEKWSEPVYKYLARLMGYDALTEDLYQETWVQALQNRKQLRDPEKFGSWLFSVARNLAFNEFRKKKRIGQVWLFSNFEDPDSSGGAALINIHPDTAPGPADHSINDERRKILTAALRELDPLSQEIFQLRYFEHFSLPEIARILKIPIGTVCTKAHRGLRKIRVELESRGIQDIGQI